MASFTDRVVRAARLDPRLYEEIEADPTALGQAMLVVVLSSLAAGVGSMPGRGPGSILVGMLTALVGWYVWAYLTYLVGTKVLPEPQTRADHGQLLRCVGFSSAPGLIRVLGVLPGFAGIVFLVASVWMLVAMVVAVRQALDYTSTLRAVGVCLIGWIIQAVLVGLFLMLFAAAPSGG